MIEQLVSSTRIIGRIPRGKFYRPGAQLQLPIHLDTQVQNTLASLANAKGVDLSVFVNDLLKKDIELIQMAR